MRAYLQNLRIVYSMPWNIDETDALQWIRKQADLMLVEICEHLSEQGI